MKAREISEAVFVRERRSYEEDGLWALSVPGVSRLPDVSRVSGHGGSTECRGSRLSGFPRRPSGGGSRPGARSQAAGHQPEVPLHGDGELCDGHRHLQQQHQRLQLLGRGPQLQRRRTRARHLRWRYDHVPNTLPATHLRLRLVARQLHRRLLPLPHHFLVQRYDLRDFLPLQNHHPLQSVSPNPQTQSPLPAAGPLGAGRASLLALLLVAVLG
jgi:hypothetical protein